MLLRAFAKINLDLRILGRRDDGYHEIRTILQTIDWNDEIHMERSDHFEFAALGVADDDSNLVVRAARAYEQVSGIKANVRIQLIKNIPIGRGLGGGSADAAATIIGLQRLNKTLLDRDRVYEALRSLGSDVPFFAVGGQAAAFGRGDEVAGLDEFTDAWLVLVDPEIAIRTSDAYSWLTLSDKSNSIEGFRDEGVSGCESEHPRNDFEGPVFERYPVLSDIKVQLQRSGAYHASLTGSGSMVYGQFQMVSEAVRAASLFNTRFRTKVTKALPRWEYFQRMVEE